MEGMLAKLAYAAPRFKPDESSEDESPPEGLLVSVAADARRSFSGMSPPMSKRKTAPSVADPLFAAVRAHVLARARQDASYEKTDDNSNPLNEDAAAELPQPTRSIRRLPRPCGQPLS
jgi:hypothetical protein